LKREIREKIEFLLKNYKKLDSNVESKLNREFPEYALKSTSFVKVLGKTNDIHSEPEEYNVEKLSPEISSELERKIQSRNIIQTNINNLTDEQQEIVKYLYFENRGIKITADDMGWSNKTIRRRRTNILKDLREGGILEAWYLWQNGST